MKKLLVIVDMQKDFIDGVLSSAESKEIVEIVKNEILQFKKNGVEVVYTRDTHGKDYLQTEEGKNLPIPHCIKDSQGWEIDKSLYQEGKIFNKDTFGSKDLVLYAQQGKYDWIELIGLCTDVCVISNALTLKTFLPQTHFVVKKSACAGISPQKHNSALDVLSSCGVEIIE